MYLLVHGSEFISGAHRPCRIFMDPCIEGGVRIFRTVAMREFVRDGRPLPLNFD